MKKKIKSIQFLVVVSAIALTAILLTPPPAHAHSGGGIPSLILTLIFYYPSIGLPIIALIIYSFYRIVLKGGYPEKKKSNIMPD